MAKHGPGSSEPHLRAKEEVSAYSYGLRPMGARPFRTIRDSPGAVLGLIEA